MSCMMLNIISLIKHYIIGVQNFIQFKVMQPNWTTPTHYHPYWQLHGYERKFLLLRCVKEIVCIVQTHDHHSSILSKYVSTHCSHFLYSPKSGDFKKATKTSWELVWRLWHNWKTNDNICDPYHQSTYYQSWWHIWWSLNLR